MLIIPLIAKAILLRLSIFFFLKYKTRFIINSIPEIIIIPKMGNITARQPSSSQVVLICIVQITNATTRIT